MMKKLLLADDSITIQKVVGIIFSTEEYQLEVTDDGDHAFTKALEEIPDLVIADISMPGKDGFELCRAIKNEPSLANTSVLLLPGAFDHFDEIKAGEVCADGWLTKPFESQALLDKVSQLLAAEPVRMAGVVTSEAEELPVETQSGTSEIGADSAVTEVALGLDAVDALATPAAEVDEESPDDIWDTVSFAEDDLQVQTEPAEVDSDDEDLQEQIEPAEVDSVDEDLPEQTEPVEMDSVDEDLLEQTEPAEMDSVDEDLLEQSEPVEMDSDDEDLLEQTEPAEMDSVDEDLQEQSEPVEMDSVDEDLQEQTEPAEMDSVDEDLPEQSEPVEMDSVDEDLQEQTEPVEVASDEDTSFAEDVIEPATDEQVLSAFAADDEDIIELQEEDEQLEPESLRQETTDSSESTSDLGEAIIDDSFDDGEIYDLSEEDIVESESLEEMVDEAAVMEPETVVAVEPEPLDGVSDLVEEEIELAEDIEPVSIDDADETFYLDETIEDDTDVATVTAGTVDMTAEVAAVSFETTGAEGSATEQVEQQLRELSEDELKEVVTKVAGSMIEKMAAEMIEKIAWEVVPDLAEVMIGEEIRKIKEGA
ncbi:MAG: response regulator [Desulfuromusa sp.]|nr:response regulator [Desulfuromusa sp.]